MDLRPGTANRWERRPSPPLALWAVDSISILVISVISSCCVWGGAVFLFLGRFSVLAQVEVVLVGCSSFPLCFGTAASAVQR